MDRLGRGPRTFTTLQSPTSHSQHGLLSPGLWTPADPRGGPSVKPHAGQSRRERVGAETFWFRDRKSPGLQVTIYSNFYTSEEDSAPQCDSLCERVADEGTAGLGVVRSKAVQAEFKGLLFLPCQTSLGDSLDQRSLESAALPSSVDWRRFFYLNDEDSNPQIRTKESPYTATELAKLKREYEGLAKESETEVTQECDHPPSHEEQAQGSWEQAQGLALFSLSAAEMLRVSDIQGHSPGRRARRQQLSNTSGLTEFLLLAFADTRELQLLHFWLFLAIYLAALLGNGLIVTAIACDHRLHTPMYFFLLNLSISDFGCVSSTLPKAMANSLWDTRAMSFSGCAAQVFWFLFFVVADYYLLTIMAYDRYVAICKPLHYGTLLGSRACVHMAAAAWGGAFLTAVLHTARTFDIQLCKGNALDQFFCEVPQILKLSCSHYYLREAGLLGVSFSLAVGCFVFIVVSYVQIFRAVLRIPSEQGQHKAFSTCLPHLTVVSLFISTAMFAYLKPPSISSPSLDPVVALFYSVVPPAVNPLIYSMRNQELKDALKKLIQSVIFQQI
ncbi:olfactory receptor 14A16-like [Chlamydotis macqueenii]